MGKPGMLPKFGSGRNPFGAKKAVGQPNRTDKSDRSAKVAAPAPLSGAGQAQARPARDSRSQIANSPDAASQKVAKKENWASKLGLLLGVRVKKRQATAPVSPPPSTRPQLELSLDKIKVVRNDLSDADVVILTAEEPSVDKGVAVGSTASGKRSGERTLSARPVEVSSASRT
jgi:hypothetical protein